MPAGPSKPLSKASTLGSRASFVGLTIVAVLLTILVVALGNAIRVGFPTLHPSDLMQLLEELQRDYRSNIFYQQTSVSVLFVLAILGIPTMLATLIGITLHHFYFQCVTNRPSISILHLILLVVRSLIVFPASAMFILLAMSWPLVKVVSASLLWWWSPGFRQARQPKNLPLMDDLLLVSLWYLFFPWAGNSELRWDSFGWKSKEIWEIPEHIKNMPISPGRLLRWLPAGLGLLAWMAYQGPQSEYNAIEITLLASIILADYFVVMLRVVPFLQAHVAARG